MITASRRTRIGFIVIASFAMLSLAMPVHAQQGKEIQISYRNKQFQPSQISAPANTPLTLRVKNFDTDSMEFESTTLRIERVIAGKGEGVINVRPLKPGRYEFFDDLNDSSVGSLNVQ